MLYSVEIVEKSHNKAGTCFRSVGLSVLLQLRANKTEKKYETKKCLFTRNHQPPPLLGGFLWASPGDSTGKKIILSFFYLVLHTYTHIVYSGGATKKELQQKHLLILCRA